MARKKRNRSISYIIFFLILAGAIIVGYRFIPNQIFPSEPSTDQSLKVTFLDVGQADSTVIQAGTNAMLIDAGSNGATDTLISSITNLGINRFDVVIATHPHEDHIGGLDAVISRFEVGQLYMPKVTAYTETFEDVLKAINDKGLSITEPLPGTSFSMGTAQCNILAPNRQNYEETNDYSVVVRLVYGDTSFVFTGDAEAESEQEILTRGYTLKSDVLKVGHHGSTSSTSDNFLNAVSPRYAVIFVGQGNEYGHPHQETLAKLNNSGIKIYRTDLNGTVTFTSDGMNLSIRTSK